MPNLSRRHFLQAGTAMAAAAALGPRLAFAAEGGSLTVAVSSLPATLEPGRETGNNAVRITYNIFDKLLDYDFDDNMKVIPRLAESYAVADDREITFKLREGVKFHNGDTLTAEDVAFTFGEDRRENSGSTRLRDYFSGIEAVEVVDPLTVRFRMKEVDPLIVERFAIWTSDIISKRAYEEAADWDAWARNPIGTGPFRLSGSIQTDRIVIEAFPDHFDGAPNVERVTFFDVPELAARVAGLAAGDYDIAAEVPPDQLDMVERNDNLRITGGPIAEIRCLVFNQGEQAQPIMRDVHLRRALSLAIDRELIVEALWDGRTIVPAGLQLATFGDKYAERPGPRYDPEEAMAELAQSAYSGEKLYFPLLPNYYTAEVATCEVLREMWLAVGIDVELAILENFDQITRGRHDIRNFATTLVYQDPSAAIWRLFNPTVVAGRGWGFDNAEFNALGTVMDSDSDPAARRDAFAKMADIWEYDDPMGAILFQGAMYYGQRKDLDWHPYPLQFMDFSNRNLGA